ncbi:hypothetical protein F4780DRAFT_740469, partial [Xylariomycetidae sp. FL0641]
MSYEMSYEDLKTLVMTRFQWVADYSPPDREKDANEVLNCLQHLTTELENLEKNVRTKETNLDAHLKSERDEMDRNLKAKEKALNDTIRTTESNLNASLQSRQDEMDEAFRSREEDLAKREEGLDKEYQTLKAKLKQQHKSSNDKLDERKTKLDKWQSELDEYQKRVESREQRLSTNEGILQERIRNQKASEETHEEKKKQLEKDQRMADQLKEIATRVQDMKLTVDSIHVEEDSKKDLKKNVKTLTKDIGIKNGYLMSQDNMLKKHCDSHKRKDAQIGHMQHWLNIQVDQIAEYQEQHSSDQRTIEALSNSLEKEKEKVKEAILKRILRTPDTSRPSFPAPEVIRWQDAPEPLASRLKNFDIGFPEDSPLHQKTGKFTWRFGLACADEDTSEHLIDFLIHARINRWYCFDCVGRYGIDDELLCPNGHCDIHRDTLLIKRPIGTMDGNLICHSV